jgi:cytochrome c biogenesis protein CcdA
LYAGYLAYLATSAKGNVRHLGLMVLAGVLAMMLLLGALMAVLAGALAEWNALLLQPLGVGIMLVMGLLLLLDVNPFARLSPLSAPTTGTGPYVRAFLYGLLFGPMIMPCAGPLAVSIFTLSLGIAGLVEQLLFFLIFGLGFGLPLLTLSFLPKDWSERMMRQFARHSRMVSIISGLALIAFGVWNLRASWELLSPFL